MSYLRAEEILPNELIETIQKYVDGQNIYIPRKAEQRREWGEMTRAKQEYLVRNQRIFEEHKSGSTVKELACRYYLSSKSIQRIIRNMR